MSGENTAIIMDIGSGLIKSGFSNAESPISVIPTTVGRKKQRTIDDPVFLGDAAWIHASELINKCPIDRAKVSNWEDLQLLFNYILSNDLRADPSEHPVFLIQNPLNPISDRYKATEVFFEEFNAPSFCLDVSGTLPLCALSRTTGVVLDIGNANTTVVPMHDGMLLKHGMSRFPFGGIDLTTWLVKLLYEGGYDLPTQLDRHQVREMKIKKCYVALDYQDELKKTVQKEEYRLMNGNLVQLQQERFMCPELLFQPFLDGHQVDGVDQILLNCIESCDEKYKRHLFKSVVLCGGSTLFPGFKERIDKDVGVRVPSDYPLKTILHPDGKYANWKGAALLASLPTFDSMKVTRADYMENGILAVAKKFNE